MKADTADAPAIRLQIGETLRAARENRGWSLQDVASQLNLTRQMLGDLETGDFGELPHTFARGYLRAYALLLPRVEVKAWAREIAELTLWIGYHQFWREAHGGRTPPDGSRSGGSPRPASGARSTPTTRASSAPT